MDGSSFDCAKLLVCLIYMLTDKTRRRITYLVDNNIVDAALHAMFQKQLLPRWFERYFEGYDLLYGVLNGLGDLFLKALEYRLTRYYISGGRTTMMVLLNDVSCADYLLHMGIDHDRSLVLARAFEEELLTFEAAHKERASQSAVRYSPD